MARNISTNAVVNLTVNGKNASRHLQELKDRAAQLNKQITDMQSGLVPLDKVRLRQLQNELKSVEKQIKTCQTEASRVGDVMRNLDKATPKELNRTLNTLKRQLNNIERGSSAWDAQMKRIKLVQAELSKVNATLYTQRSGWQRMNQYLNDTQTFFMGLGAALTGFVLAGRKAVNSFAQMDEQLANTRKYTQMTEKDVLKLNSSFKDMDTRTAREQLNLLAQEGGRLGKNTIESVKGYVEAAEIINVALVDLGEGATQTIAKIANIFGVEQQLGTKQAMLSIGSAVNVLSQNCTASKPYLVEFAQRMAGIGAQAGLTVPQILAFGAVLDANGQKVEMSATAIQKIIMALANKNKEFSETLGLDAEVMSQTLKSSAKDGILMYLEAIKRLSDKTSANNATIAIAPLFKDMGMDAARVATVLSTLANHIDQLKWQFGEADKAFREATSATKEYEIFNNTAQASIDKSKNIMHEYAVELGEKLYPLMKHVYTSSGIFLRVLKTMIDFLAKNYKSIIALTAAIAAYTVAANLATIRTKAMAAAHVAGSVAAKAYRAALLLVEAAAALATGNISRATAAMRVFNAVTKISPVGLLTAALSALAVMLIKVRRESESLTSRISGLMDLGENWREETVKEQTELTRLFGKLEGAKKGTKSYQEAKNAIISQYGKYLGGLVDEKGEIVNLAQAYDLLSEAIRRSARERAIDAASQKVEDEYVKSSAQNLKLLRNALKSYGASELQVETVMSAVSSATATGKFDNKKVSGLVDRISANSPTMDNKTGKVLSRGQIMAAEIGVSFADVSSPRKIIDRILGEYGEKRESQNRLEKMKYPDGIVDQKDSADPVMAKDQYRDLLTRLDKVIDSGTTQRIVLPQEYQPQRKPLTSRPLVLKENSPYTNGLKTQATALDNLGEGVDFSLPDHKLDNVKGVFITPQQAEKIKADIIREMSLRGMMQYSKSPSPDNSAQDVDQDSADGYQPSGSEGRSAGKEAAERRREEIKARQEFRDGLAALRAETEKYNAQITAAYASGQTDYETYLTHRMWNERKYYDDAREYYERNFSSVKDSYLEDDKDYQQLLSRKEEVTVKYQEKITGYQSEMIRRRASFEQEQLKRDASVVENKTVSQEVQFQQRLTEILMRSIEERQDLLAVGTEQWEKLQLEKEQTTEESKMEIDRIYLEKVKELRSQYDSLSAAERFSSELSVLDTLFQMRRISEDKYKEWRVELQKKYSAELPGADFSRSPEEIRKRSESVAAKKKSEVDDAVDAGLISENEGKGRKSQIDAEAWRPALESVKSAGGEWVAMVARLGEAWVDLWKSVEDGGTGTLDKIGAVAGATFAAVTEGMRIASEFAQANAQIEIAAVEKRYDREVQLAQGNTYLTAKLEKEKEKKVAEIKSKASEASFRMQVIQAVGQAIQGGINAYTSTLAIPVVGPALAPAAAAVALASGMANVALLKKQQEASQAQGYSEGGYTRPGAKDDVAGVVHAGEWVASQKLLANPEAAAVVARLEQAQRSGDDSQISMMYQTIRSARMYNTVGSLTFEDASRVVANGAAARTADNTAAVAGSSAAVAAATARRAAAPQRAPYASGDSDRLSAVIDRLNDRLDEPFTTVNSVAGEYGMQNAWDRYDRLIRNKNRKKRKRG